MTSQNTSPLDALKQFGISAGENETFVVLGTEAMQEIATAVGEAVAYDPKPNWAFCATFSEDVGAARIERPEWHCRVLRTPEAPLAECRAL